MVWADNAIKLAVEMTVAGLNRLNLQGNAEQQAQEMLQAMRILFPEGRDPRARAREGFDHVTRRDTAFVDSQGVRCAAQLYLTDEGAGPHRAS